MLAAHQEDDTTLPPDRDSNPFTAPVGERQPARRLRGRLPGPVTILTSGHQRHATGLTVSSIVVAEGDTSLVYCLVGSATDLFYAVSATGKFVVHVCEGGDSELADVFAGLRPSPGGLFLGRSVTPTEYGPVLDELGTRAYCSLLDTTEETYSTLMSAVIDRIELTDIDDPLAYFRGRYRTLD